MSGGVHLWHAHGHQDTLSVVVATTSTASYFDLYRSNRITCRLHTGVQRIPQHRHRAHAFQGLHAAMLAIPSHLKAYLVPAAAR